MRLIKILAFVTTFFCLGIINAQTTNSTVKGKVVNDTTGKPLQSATVTLVGTKKVQQLMLKEILP